MNKIFFEVLNKHLYKAILIFYFNFFLKFNANPVIN